MAREIVRIELAVHNALTPATFKATYKGGIHSPPYNQHDHLYVQAKDELEAYQRASKRLAAMDARDTIQRNSR